MATLISPTDLAELVSIDESAMIDTATIIRDVITSDGAGGQTQTPSTVGVTKCRLLERRVIPHDGAVAGELQTFSPLLIHVPTGTVLQNTDRLVIGVRTFEVGHATPHTWQTSLMVHVVEIT